MLGLIKERKPFYILMVDKQLEVSAAIGFYSLVIFCGFVVRIMYSPFELIDVNLLGNILYYLCMCKGNLRHHSLRLLTEFNNFPGSDGLADIFFFEIKDRSTAASYKKKKHSYITRRSVHPHRNKCTQHNATPPPPGRGAEGKPSKPAPPSPTLCRAKDAARC